MNYLSQDWIAEQVSALEKHSASLQESIADLHNAANEAPRMRELLASTKAELEQLQRRLAEQEASLAESTKAGVETLEGRVTELLEAWENPAEEYLRNRLQESEARTQDLLNEANAAADARVARLTERLERLQAMQADHAASILELDARIKALADDRARLHNALEQEAAVRDEIATALNSMFQKFIHESRARHADFEEKLEAGATELQRLEARIEESNTHLGGLASEASAAIGSLEERMSATEGSVRGLSSTVTRLNAFVSWFKKAGPFARLRGGR